MEKTTSLPNNEELTSIRNTPQQCGGPLMHKGCKEFNCRKAACRKRRLIATRFFGSRHDQIWFAPTGWGTLDAFAQGALLIAFAKKCTEFTRRKAACRKRRLIAIRFFGSRHDQIAPTVWGALVVFAQGVQIIRPNDAYMTFLCR